PELLGSLRDAVAPGAGEELLLPVVEVVAALLSADAELRTTAELALSLVARATGAERAHLVLADAERTAFGLPGGPPRPATASQGVLDEVARTRATVVVGDARRDPRFADRPSIQDLQVRSVLCAPVLAEGGEVLVGALYLDGPARRFGARERAVVEGLAALVGPQLWSARRREEAERGRERAERLLVRERAAREPPALLGRSPALVELRRLIDRMAPAPHAVLIEGESGAGKELVARALHAASPRADGPFVAENVGALAGGLAEAELFGHERGAFTGADEARQGLFQLASGGTLLLDEVADMPLELQGLLLRALQEGEVRPLGGARAVRVDVRVLAATHRDLQAEVKAGRFREDLYFRLSTLRLRVPPLRERPGDVPLLLEHHLAREAAAHGRPPPVVPPDLLGRLEAHPWPGNVRELQAYAARYLIVGPHLPGDDAPRRDDAPGLSLELRLGDGASLELRDARARFDRAYLAAVLARFEGNVTLAARALGMNRSHLSVLVSRYDLRR
ncbi:MAG: sigma-54-dependent Fis family transcriptional regulator, partial [Planctomycetes bacterium]|nr:sigma-54-dependent Fis family transcriptional regulator [Planctomycetota bacterium]